MTAAGGVDSIPAIPEEDASGDIATLYADLRATLGVPFVNLIWRHLATHPGWPCMGLDAGEAALRERST
jgi:hypothetical protein